MRRPQRCEYPGKYPSCKRSSEHLPEGRHLTRATGAAPFVESVAALNNRGAKFCADCRPRCFAVRLKNGVNPVDPRKPTIRMAVWLIRQRPRLVILMRQI